MFSTIGDLNPYLIYLVPPLVGAFIGYLTNRVAIRMLFRPLKGWYLGPVKIPMTPGVIPSKRHELAINIGEMVGEHLVTGDEINRALQKDDFQEHLRILVETMAASLTKKEFGSIRSIVPERFATYLDIAHKTVTYRIKEHIRLYICSEETEKKLEDVIDKAISRFLSTPVDTIFPLEERRRFTDFLAETLLNSVERREFEERLTTFLEIELVALQQSGKSTADILPAQLTNSIVEVFRNQTPHVLDQAAALLKDPDVQDKLVAAAVDAVDEFIDTLGPMSTMARGFLAPEMVEEKIRAYLRDKGDDIEEFFRDETIVIRVRAALGERIGSLLATPLTDIEISEKGNIVPKIAEELAGAISRLLRKTDTKNTLADLLHSSLNTQLDECGGEIGSLIGMRRDSRLIETTRSRIRQGVISALRSPEGLGVVDHVVEEFCGGLLIRPIGRLDHLVPSGVIDGVCRSIREMTTRVLVAEVPSVVALIKIKDMVTEKIDSYDLLRLEQLLLSIMAEQFKYINLFGALLGFIIGCANLLFLIGR